MPYEDYLTMRHKEEIAFLKKSIAFAKRLSRQSDVDLYTKRLEVEKAQLAEWRRGVRKAINERKRVPSNR